MYKEGNQLSPDAANSVSYYNRQGVLDYGNLIAIETFETGYVLLGVLGAPDFYTTFPDQKDRKDFKALQNLFINILEHDFKGLDGIGDITSDTVDVADNISGSSSSISKVNREFTSDISMRYYEKSATPITTYISKYLTFIKDARTQLKGYNGYMEFNAERHMYGFQREFFDLLYIVTDSTCLKVEKAFLLANAQLRSASLSDVYTADKGEIGVKEVTVNLTCNVLDGAKVNNAAAAYLATAHETGYLILNSNNYDWSICDGDSTPHKLSEYKVSKGKISR